MPVQEKQQRAPVPGGIETALRLVEEADGYRNLGQAVPIFFFFLSGGMAMRGFFWFIDALTWLGLARLDPVLPTSVSFVFFFLAWAFLFLVLVSLLDCLKLGHVETIARNRLAGLALDRFELAQLRRAVDAGTWTHARALKNALAGLDAAPPPGPAAAAMDRSGGPSYPGAGEQRQGIGLGDATGPSEVDSDHER